MEVSIGSTVYSETRLSDLESLVSIDLLVSTRGSRSIRLGRLIKQPNSQTTLLILGSEIRVSFQDEWDASQSSRALPAYQTNGLR